MSYDSPGYESEEEYGEELRDGFNIERNKDLDK